jgi:hypothetical protein
MNRESKLNSIVTRLIVSVVLAVLVGCNANNETDGDPQPSATPESAEMQELRAEEARLRVEFVMQTDMISGSDRAKTTIGIGDTEVEVIGEAIPGISKTFSR